MWRVTRLGPTGVLRSLYRAYFRQRRRLAARLVPLPPAPAPFDASQVRRALLVSTGLIGDTLMSLPALCAARRILPVAELVGLVTPKTRAILSMAGCVDDFIVSDGAPLRVRAEARREAARVEAEMERGRFELAVVFLGDDYAPAITRAGVPHRVFVADATYGPLATATYDIGHPRTWGPQERLNAWRALGLEPGEGPVRLVPPPRARGSLETRLGLTLGPHTLILHPFGSSVDQWWPLPLAQDLIQHADKRLGLTSLVVGAGAEAVCQSPHDPRFRLVGQLTLEELAALLEASACVVSTDSGPYHLAGVLGRPGVGLFRASRPEHARRYPSITPIVGPDLEVCRGRCSWDRCRERPCRQMSALSVESVLGAVEARMSQSR